MMRAMLLLLVFFAGFAFGEETDKVQLAEAVIGLVSRNVTPGFEPENGTPLFPIDFDFEDQAHVLNSIRLLGAMLDEQNWWTLLNEPDDGEYCITLIGDHDVGYSYSTSEVIRLLLINVLIYPYQDDLGEIRSVMQGIDVSWATSELRRLEHIRKWTEMHSPSKKLYELQKQVGSELRILIRKSNLPDDVKERELDLILRRSQSIERSLIPKMHFINELNGLREVNKEKAELFRNEYAKQILSQ